MARAERPERTREHYIASLSINHVERFIVRCGHVADRPGEDYGYDLVVTTFDYQGDQAFTRGYIENGHLLIQLKATDEMKVSVRDRRTVSLRISRRHVTLWVREPMPVILVVYDVAGDTAYWLHMQTYLRDHIGQMSSTQEELTVHLSKDAVLNEEAVESFRRYKEEAIKRFER